MKKARTGAGGALGGCPRPCELLCIKTLRQNRRFLTPPRLRPGLFIYSVAPIGARHAAPHTPVLGFCFACVLPVFGWLFCVHLAYTATSAFCAAPKENGVVHAASAYHPPNV